MFPFHSINIKYHNACILVCLTIATSLLCGCSSNGNPFPFPEDVELNSHVQIAALAGHDDYRDDAGILKYPSEWYFAGLPDGFGIWSLSPESSFEYWYVVISPDKIEGIKEGQDVGGSIGYSGGKTAVTVDGYCISDEAWNEYCKDTDDQDIKELMYRDFHLNEEQCRDSKWYIRHNDDSIDVLFDFVVNDSESQNEEEINRGTMRVVNRVIVNRNTKYILQGYEKANDQRTYDIICAILQSFSCIG